MQFRLSFFPSLMNLRIFPPSIASTPATAHEPYFSSATMASALSHETLESPHFERTLARAAAGKENHHA